MPPDPPDDGWSVSFGGSISWLITLPPVPPESDSSGLFLSGVGVMTMPPIPPDDCALFLLVGPFPGS